jgi:hypothetical protein
MSLAEIQGERLYKMLTDEQRRFLDVYITTDGNLDEAAIAAQPDLKGKDRRHIRATGGRFLKDSMIDILQRKHFSPDDITPDEFLRFIWKTIKAENDGKTIASLAALYAKVRETTDASWAAQVTPTDKPKSTSAQSTEPTSGSVFDGLEE